MHTPNDVCIQWSTCIIRALAPKQSRQRLFSWQLGAQLQTEYLGEEILIHPQAICRQSSLQSYAREWRDFIHLSTEDVLLSICLWMAGVFPFSINDVYLPLFQWLASQYMCTLTTVRKRPTVLPVVDTVLIYFVLVVVHLCCSNWSVSSQGKYNLASF